MGKKVMKIEAVQVKPANTPELFKGDWIQLNVPIANMRVPGFRRAVLDVDSICDFSPSIRSFFPQKSSTVLNPGESWEGSLVEIKIPAVNQEVPAQGKMRRRVIMIVGNLVRQQKTDIYFAVNELRRDVMSGSFLISRESIPAEKEVVTVIIGDKIAVINEIRCAGRIVLRTLEALTDMQEFLRQAQKTIFRNLTENDCHKRFRELPVSVLRNIGRLYTSWENLPSLFADSIFEIVSEEEVFEFEPADEGEFIFAEEDVVPAAAA